MRRRTVTQSSLAIGPPRRTRTDPSFGSIVVLSAYVAVATAFEVATLASRPDGSSSVAMAALVATLVAFHAFPAGYILRLAYLRTANRRVRKVVRGPTLGMATSASLTLVLAAVALGGLSTPRDKAVLLSLASEVAAAASVLAFARRRPTVKPSKGGSNVGRRA